MSEPTTEPDTDQQPPAPPPPARRRAWRWLSYALAALVILIMALGGAAYWVIGTESGSRQGLELATRLTGGMIRVEGWHGRLLDRWQADRFELHLTGFRLVASKADVSWQLRPLLDRDVRLHWLRVDSLDIRTAPSAPTTEPSGPPKDVSLPVAIHADEVRAETLTVGTLAESDPQPDPSVTLTGIAGRVDSDAVRHIVDQLAVTTPAGHVTGRVQMATASPFALQADLSLAASVQAREVRVDATADGDLLTPHILARVAGEGIDGHADVTAQPFEAVPLRSADVMLNNVDPAEFVPDAPRGRFDVQATLTPSVEEGASAANIADWRVTGPVRIVNKEPGSVDHQRIPVEKLESSLTWVAGMLTADALRLDLPGKGVVTGSVTWRPQENDTMGRIQGQLRLANIDPSRIWSTISPMSVAGEVSATAQAKNQQFALKLASNQYRLQAQGEQRDGVLRLSQAELATGTSSLTTSGQIELGGQQRFSARGATIHFDPQQIVKTAPRGNLNAKFEVSGHISPQWQAALKLDLGNSQLAGRALSGGGSLAVAPGRVSDADLDINVLDNTLRMQGAFGKVGDSLQYALDARHLDRLGAGVGGTATAKGTLAGTLENPSGDIEAHANGLVLPGLIRIERANLTAHMQDGLDGVFQGKLDMGSLRVGAADSEPIVRSATASADGRRNAHVMTLAADLAYDEHVQVRTQGGFVDGAFRGQLQQLAASGPVAFELVEPVALEASPERVTLASAKLRAQNGNVELQQTEWSPARIVAKGSISGVQFGLMARDDGTGQPRSERARARTLRLGGNWDVTLGDNPTGLVRIFREGGDLILQGDSPVALGLETLEATVALQDNRLTVNALANGKRLGDISLVASAATRGIGSDITLDMQAPLVGVGHVNMPSVDWVGPFIDPNLRTAGSFNGQFNILGTPANPKSAGNLAGEKLEIGLADQGMRLTDGVLSLSFDASQVKVDTLKFVSRNTVAAPDPRLRVLNLNYPGGVTGSGTLQLATGKGAFRIDVDHVGVAQQANQWILVSGATTIDTGWDSFNLNAQLKADGGFVGVPKSSAPSLDDDVVVRGRQVKEASNMRLNADVAFDFGENFILKAYGINTYLDGVLRLRIASRQPMSATGSIRARNGVFDGYGQRLTIDRGVVNFQGPLTNPSLNVVALRKGLAVEAGVEVTGSANNPRVRLVSQPNVPETEKLSWMLLGRASEPGTGDAGLLLSAASAAMGGGTGEGPVEKIVHGLGLDDISVGQSSGSERPLQSQVASNATGLGTSLGASSDAADQVLSVGKRISARAYLSLEQNFIGTESVVKLSYTLTRYLSLIARAGTDNAIDLAYTITFR